MAYSYATIDVSELQVQKQEWRSASGRIAVRLRGELGGEFFRGRTVEVAGVIAYPAKAAAPGLFDYRAYLHNTRVFYQLKSDSPKDWQLQSHEPMPITERFRRWAQKQLQRGVPADEASETIAAMTLGLRNSMSGEMSDVFMRTGTLHIIAISGLHVACIAYFFSCVVRLFGLPRSIEGLIIIGVVWFYTAATGHAEFGVSIGIDGDGVHAAMDHEAAAGIAEQRSSERSVDFAGATGTAFPGKFSTEFQRRGSDRHGGELD